MTKLIGLCILAIALSAGITSVTNAADNPAAAASETAIKGDLLKIDGEFYVVKDTTGKEIRLHVDKTTKMDGTFKAGDKVEVQATDKDHAVSIKQAPLKK